MKPAAGRLLVTAVLFLGWLGYLGYLVATRPLTADGRPLVLSRPQALVSDLDVVAHLDSLESMLQLRAVSAWALGAQAQSWLLMGAGPVPSLVGAASAALRTGADYVEVREVLYPQGDRPIAPGVKLAVTNMPGCRGFSAPGDYLLLLHTTGSDGSRYEVAAVPPSPGFTKEPPRIYPCPKILPQYREVRKE